MTALVSQLLPLVQVLLAPAVAPIFLTKFKTVAIIVYLPLQYLLEYSTLVLDFPFISCPSTSPPPYCSFYNAYLGLLSSHIISQYFLRTFLLLLTFFESSCSFLSQILQLMGFFYTCYSLEFLHKLLYYLTFLSHFL